MTCPKCGSYNVYTKTTRFQEENNSTYRRRRCYDCGYTFTTYEITDKHLVEVLKREAREMQVR